MNISRYTWPVIIAAGLHSALFLAVPRDPTVAVRPAKPPATVLPEFPPDLQMVPVPAETEANDPAAGAVSALPAQPDIPSPLVDPAVMTMPVSENVAPLRPVHDLKVVPTNPFGPGGAEGPGGGIGAPKLPTVRDLDRHPRAMAQGSPEYPYSLRNDGVSGSVTVEFLVGTDGNVLSAQAVKWTHRDFVEPAIRAVSRWKFEPGTIQGRKVPFRMAVPIEFNAAAR